VWTRGQPPAGLAFLPGTPARLRKSSWAADILGRRGLEFLQSSALGKIGDSDSEGTESPKCRANACR